MTAGEKKYELIERYLNGELSGKELADFEKQMQEDAAWKREVELHQQVQDFLADEGAQKLRMVMADAANQVQPAKVLPFYKRSMAVAASVLILIVAGYFIWTSNSSHSAQELFAQHFEPYQMVLSSRSQDSVSEVRNAAINAYQEGRYQDAIIHFNRLMQEDTAGTATAFYKGICYLAAGEAAKSIAVLDSVKNSGNLLFREQTLWYLGLAWLKNGDTQKACDQFTILSTINEYNQQQRERLMEQICH